MSITPTGSSRANLIALPFPASDQDNTLQCVVCKLMQSKEKILSVSCSMHSSRNICVICLANPQQMDCKACVVEHPSEHHMSIINSPPIHSPSQNISYIPQVNPAPNHSQCYKFSCVIVGYLCCCISFIVVPIIILSRYNQH